MNHFSIYAKDNGSDRSEPLQSNQYRAADIIRNWLCHTSPQYIIRIIRFTLPQINQYGGTTIEKHLTAGEHYRREYICQLKTHG